MLEDISGTVADNTVFDSGGIATAKIISGFHKGHKVTFETNKFNCGVYAEDVDCSCEMHWHNAMNGCWQNDHQRDEYGDPELAELAGEIHKTLL